MAEGELENGVFAFANQLAEDDTLASSQDEREQIVQNEALCWSNKLSGYEALVLAALDEVPIAALRAILPHQLLRQQSQVVALLDLALRDLDRLAMRLPLIDYLVTLLSIEPGPGPRPAVRDPVSISPGLEALCRESEKKYKSAAKTLSESFRGAAATQDPALLPAVLERMREQKEDLGVRLFEPSVLRAVVAYNTRMAKRISEIGTVECETDPGFNGVAAALGIDVGDLLEVASEESPPSSKPETKEAAEPTPLGDCETLREIAAHCTQSSPSESDGPARRVAALVDLQQLTETERAALRSFGECATDEALGCAIALGLVIGTLPDSMLDLVELGIDAERLQNEWVDEAGTALSKKVAEAIANGAYDEACLLTESKSKSLYAPKMAKLRRDQEAQRSSTLPPAPTVPYEEGLHAFDALPRSETKIPNAPEKWRIDRRFLPIAASLAMVLAASVNFVRAHENSVRIYSKAHLAVMSQYLESAHRGDEGRGSLFVGEVNADWKSLSDSERKEEAQSLVEYLRSRGASEIMIFDERRIIQIQARNGRLTYVRP